MMIVKITMRVEDVSGKGVDVDIHSQEGVVVHGRIWPADLDLVNAIQRQITDRRGRYPPKSKEDTGEPSSAKTTSSGS